jgi:hypothetical protein
MKLRKLHKRIALLDARITALEQRSIPEPISEPLNIHELWANASSSYAQGWDDDDGWRRGLYL